MKLKAVGAVAIMSVGLLGVSTMAHALTTETRVVSAFAYDDWNGTWVDPDTGWADHSTQASMMEIGAAYGAPQGLGGEALMLDTPGSGDTTMVLALAASPDFPNRVTAFPQDVAATPDIEIGFSLYLPEESQASPILRTSLGFADNSWWAIAFDPIANSYAQRGTWMRIDTTADTAQWTVSIPGESDALMSWPQLVEAAAQANDAGAWATLASHGYSFSQHQGTYSAIDGVTVANAEWSVTVDFELAPTSARPVLDDCKNDGWQTHPAGPFKNQGACIAAIVAAN